MSVKLTDYFDICINPGQSDAEFDRMVDDACEKKTPDYNGKVNIALIGKVSAGKSSLLNALLQCDRQKPLAHVGANSGVTTEITPHSLGEDVLIIDCPGLDDVRKDNSAVTTEFLKHIDVGIFVVTGSADAAQKANFADLQQHAEKVFVVLNKIDEWDDLDKTAYADVVQQWQETLGVKKIFGTCTKGYDPNGTYLSLSI